MKKILALVVALVLASPGVVLALGLGRMELESVLNEPLEARIKLLSATRDELDSLGIALADAEAFTRAGIDRPFMLSQLRFELHEEAEGPGYIRVYTREALREPILNFLLEVNWSTGRLFREYTVLIDPPLYAAGQPEVPAAPRAATLDQVPSAEPGLPEDAAEAAPAVSAAPFTGGEYGPTTGSDTLWSIASRMRPDASVTVQQMMLALLRSNPEAFINGNINGLKKGRILRAPSAEDLTAVSAAEAMTQVKGQYALWEDARGSMAAAAAPRPESAAAPQAAASAEKAPAATAPAPAKSELKLLAAAEGAKNTVAGGPAESGAVGNAAAALATEKAASLEQENLELKDRMTEAETIIEDLKRLIALKDDELAAMQKKLAADAAAVKQKPGAEAAAAPVPEEQQETEPAPVVEDAATEVEPAVTPPEEPAPPEPAAEKPTPAADEPAAEQEQTDAGVMPAAPSEEPATGGGLVDQVVQMLTANMVLIGGVLLAVVVIVVGGSALQKKLKSRSAATASSDLEFPDFSEGKDDAVPAAEDETDMGPGMDVPMARESAKPRAEDSTVFAAPAPRQAAAPAAAPATAAPQEDPLAEVNVFLAYEHFDQAEDFVREAIKREPHNLEFHSKLLEVFYAAGDRKKYEQAAKVLHDMVQGSGPHWEMTLAMWQELSPARALFAEGGAEDEAPAPAAAGGGMLDLTAKEASAGAALDFDIGDSTSDQSGTGSEAPAGDESILDVTAAVGLDVPMAAPAPAAGGGDDLLDITGGSSDEGLLDVTAHTNVNEKELDSGSDLLDVTAAVGLSPDADELSVPEAPEEPKDEMSLDFDLNLDAGTEPAPEEESAAKAEFLDNALEFDLGGAGESADDAGAVLDLSAGAGIGGDELDLGLESSEAAPEAEQSTGDDALDLSLDFESGDQSSGLEFDMGNEAAPADAGADLESTVAMPKLSLADEDSDDDDDDEDHTVFVPRSGGTKQQSAEDEIATKLDLAKAYVELGDKDSAKGILDEIVAEGNAQQKRQAQELMNQLG